MQRIEHAAPHGTMSQATWEYQRSLRHLQGLMQVPEGQHQHSTAHSVISVPPNACSVAQAV